MNTYLHATIMITAMIREAKDTE